MCFCLSRRAHTRKNGCGPRAHAPCLSSAASLVHLAPPRPSQRPAARVSQGYPASGAAAGEQLLPATECVTRPADPQRSARVLRPARNGRSACRRTILAPPHARYMQRWGVAGTALLLRRRWLALSLRSCRIASHLHRALSPNAPWPCRFLEKAIRGPEPGAQVFEPLHLTSDLRAPPDVNLHSLLSFFVFLSV